MKGLFPYFKLAKLQLHVENFDRLPFAVPLQLLQSIIAFEPSLVWNNERLHEDNLITVQSYCMEK